MRFELMLFALSISFAVGTQSLAHAATPSFAVIVGADVDEHSISRETLSFLFQRKQTFWRSGKRVQPVNLPLSHPLRRSFSACVLGQEPEAMEDYWREMYFHGVLPPHVLESEEAVVLFVNSTPGAIGYISTCSPNLHARVLLSFGDSSNCPKPSTSCLPLQDR